MKRCRGQVVQVTADTSLVVKGETLSDIRTLACYGIRHPQVGSAQEAAKYSPIPIIDAGDGTLSRPSNVVSAARRAGISVTICESESLDEVIADTDVLYVTKVQKERFANETDWLQVKDAYRVDHAVLSRAREDMIVMHPLPRVNEIDPVVDYDSRRAVYLR
ncbi:hypothetical protein GALMADRAFT_252298 [Galerina marginata CBS 339.88]|uniref:Aspartate/ornithine carbamoyltransferase Asp/Orn-binding domain-containing protein n=1 Tax=Galerina marginata (strain CBS 339.88) TaxID=685588 RepID=A0A067SQ09_GALM3|nr:hypothetical protein GALMADRAFT_252298 [Galerina marginata CBS 339.88]